MNICKYCGKECETKFCNTACANRFWNPITKTGKPGPTRGRTSRITIKYNCKGCGNEFDVTATEWNILKGRHTQHCSRACANKRIHSEETKANISRGVRKFLVESGIPLKDKVDEPKAQKLPRPIKTCKYCSAPLDPKLRKGRKYCSDVCLKTHLDKISEEKILKGSSNSDGRRFKTYLIKTRGHKCEICGLSELQGQPIPLILDHINGRACETTLDNLRLVCGNCDMQLPTYKSKNKNSDRRDRRLRRLGLLGKSCSPGS